MPNPYLLNHLHPNHPLPPRHNAPGYRRTGLNINHTHHTTTGTRITANQYSHGWTGVGSFTGIPVTAIIASYSFRNSPTTSPAKNPAPNHATAINHSQLMPPILLPHAPTGNLPITYQP